MIGLLKLGSCTILEYNSEIVHLSEHILMVKPGVKYEIHNQ